MRQRERGCVRERAAEREKERERERAREKETECVLGVLVQRDREKE